MSLCLDRPLVLVGPMGSGKTTVGRALNRLTSLPLIDLDDEIVKVNGMSIPEIFKHFGESGFRERETAVLKAFIREKAILSSGGGIITVAQNRALIKENSICVFLDTSPIVQFKRTEHDDNRPMIATDDRLARLEALYAKRLPFYKEVADFTVNTDELGPKKLALLIEEFLQNR